MPCNGAVGGRAEHGVTCRFDVTGAERHKHVYGAAEGWALFRLDDGANLFCRSLLFLCSDSRPALLASFQEVYTGNSGSATVAMEIE